MKPNLGLVIAIVMLISGCFSKNMVVPDIDSLSHVSYNEMKEGFFNAP